MKEKLDYFDVNNRIIQIMREKGYNKNSLAKAMGMAQPTIKQIESNENLPSLKFLFEFKALFPDINFNWLLTGRGNKIDLVGEYDIKHEGVIEYDFHGYSMRYYDLPDCVETEQPTMTSTGDLTERYLKMLEVNARTIESQQQTIADMAKKMGNNAPRGVARAGE